MYINYDDFTKVDLRVGKIVAIEDFDKVKKAPSYKVQVDFGPEIGMKWSSVGAKREYTKEEMLERYVIGVVNFPPKNVAGFMSGVLLLGCEAEDGSLSLLAPTRGAKIGSKIY